MEVSCSKLRFGWSYRLSHTSSSVKVRQDLVLDMSKSGSAKP
jgi:hypothetical protein